MRRQCRALAIAQHHRAGARRSPWKHQPNAVGAIGHIVHLARIQPQHASPASAVFTVDFRSPCARPDARQAMVRRARWPKAPKLCEALGVGCSPPKPLSASSTPPPSTRACVKAVRDAAAERLGYSHMNLVSGAGHDACWAARSPPPPWSCAPASAASATTRRRKYPRNGRRPGATCCFMRWWRRRGLWGNAKRSALRPLIRPAGTFSPRGEGREDDASGFSLLPHGEKVARRVG